MNSEIAFFKVITSSETMGIPQKSVARMMRGMVGKRVILRGVDEKVWSVEVERDEDGFSFKKGWPQFYQKNSLSPGDMMVFTCTGANSFDFRLLGFNACDSDTKRSSTSTQTFNRVKEEEEDDEGDEEEEEPVQIYKACTQHTSFTRVKEEEEEEDEGDEEENVADKADNKKKKGAADWYGHDIFNSGLTIRPRNPYFVSRSRKPRKNELYIPRQVVEDFQLEIPARLNVFDTSGRKWESRIKKWTDGRLWCTGGWKSLCSFNNIGVDDTCICEFVQQPQHGLYMLVHLVANGGSGN